MKLQNAWGVKSKTINGIRESTSLVMSKFKFKPFVRYEISNHIFECFYTSDDELLEIRKSIKNWLSK